MQLLALQIQNCQDIMQVNRINMADSLTCNEKRSIGAVVVAVQLEAFEHACPASECFEQE